MTGTCPANPALCPPAPPAVGTGAGRQARDKGAQYKAILYCPVLTGWPRSFIKVRHLLARIHRFVKGNDPLHYASIEILDFFRR